jgi:hypothetical protein
VITHPISPVGRDLGVVGGIEIPWIWEITPGETFSRSGWCGGEREQQQKGREGSRSHSPQQGGRGRRQMAGRAPLVCFRSPFPPPPRLASQLVPPVQPTRPQQMTTSARLPPEQLSSCPNFFQSEQLSWPWGLPDHHFPYYANKLFALAPAQLQKQN